MKKVLGLCNGRHPIEHVEGYIFPNTVNPLDIDVMAATVDSVLSEVTQLDLYVTGLTVALVEVIKYCVVNNVELTLYHYDKESGGYYPQHVNTRKVCPFCGQAFGSGVVCASCGAT